jgi:hypothetical protein
MSDKALVFVSCGQYTKEERDLGRAVCTLVDGVPGLEAYFAENQSSFEGLSKNIFGALEKAAGFVAIMHKRGEVATPKGKHDRASVWIEQEIAIVSYLQATRPGDAIRVAAYAEKGIHREGVRDTIILNPTEFETNDQVLADLRAKLGSWNLRPYKPREPKVHIDLGYEKDPSSTGLLHSYRTKIIMRNDSAVQIANFTAELRFPRQYALPIRVLSEVLDRPRSDPYRVFRQQTTNQVLLPEDSVRILGIGYQMNDDLHSANHYKPEFQMPVSVRVFVNDQLAGEASKPFSEMQCF